jgi:hypothetical protein
MIVISKMEVFPIEIWGAILCRLSVADRLRLRSCSKELNAIVLHEFRQLAVPRDVSCEHLVSALGVLLGVSEVHIDEWPEKDLNCLAVLSERLRRLRVVKLYEKKLTIVKIPLWSFSCLEMLDLRGSNCERVLLPVWFAKKEPLPSLQTLLLGAYDEAEMAFGRHVFCFFFFWFFLFFL